MPLARKFFPHSGQENSAAITASGSSVEGELGVWTLQGSLGQRESWGRGEWRRNEGGLINTGDRKWRHKGGKRWCGGGV